MIYPFKGRTLNPHQPVDVYRNLNGDKKSTWSLRQNGLVVAHANRLKLKMVSFQVSKAGWKRSKREMQRNVHAVAHGYVHRGTPPLIPQHRVKYNRQFGVFMDQNGLDVWSAADVWFLPDKVLANYVSHERDT